MFKKILASVGLRSKSPVVKFFSARSLFGLIPALGLLGYRYRGQIGRMIGREGKHVRGRHGRGELTAHGEREHLMHAPG